MNLLEGQRLPAHVRAPVRPKEHRRLTGCLRGCRGLRPFREHPPYPAPQEMLGLEHMKERLPLRNEHSPFVLQGGEEAGLHV